MALGLAMLLPSSSVDPPSTKPTPAPRRRSWLRDSSDRVLHRVGLVRLADRRQPSRHTELLHPETLRPGGCMSRVRGLGVQGFAAPTTSLPPPFVDSAQSDTVRSLGCLPPLAVCLEGKAPHPAPAGRASTGRMGIPGGALRIFPYDSRTGGASRFASFFLSKKCLFILPLCSC